MTLRVLAGLLLGLLTAAPAAAAADGGLEQRIDRGQAVADGRKVIAAGHVDIGPHFVEGRWTVMIHDDEAKDKTGGRSVWRFPEHTVLRVSDAARQTVPEDPAYAFLHAPAGSRVHVVPQTQDPHVVWVGWNTQDPTAMERIDRGVTMTLTGVDGPGDLVVFLQSGDFSAPQRLWDSTARARPIWVDVNTHTHANWVFTRPGVYLVRVRIAAELVDGTKVSDTRALRFAVGASATDAQAFAAVDAAAGADDATAAAPAPADRPAEDGSGSSALVAVIAVLAAALVVTTAAVLARARRTKRQARATPGPGPGR
jgi:putative ABC transporter-associated repeat protein